MLGKEETVKRVLARLLVNFSCYLLPGLTPEIENSGLSLQALAAFAFEVYISIILLPFRETTDGL